MSDQNQGQGRNKPGPKPKNQGNNQKVQVGETQDEKQVVQEAEAEVAQSDVPTVADKAESVPKRDAREIQTFRGNGRIDR